MRIDVACFAVLGIYWYMVNISYIIINSINGVSYKKSILSDHSGKKRSKTCFLGGCLNFFLNHIANPISMKYIKTYKILWYKF